MLQFLFVVLVVFVVGVFLFFHVGCCGLSCSLSVSNWHRCSRRNCGCSVVINIAVVSASTPIIVTILMCSTHLFVWFRLYLITLSDLSDS